MNSRTFLYTCRCLRFRKLVLCFALGIMLLTYISFTNMLAYQQYNTRNAAFNAIKSAHGFLKLLGTVPSQTPKLSNKLKPVIMNPDAQPTESYVSKHNLHTQTEPGMTTSPAPFETFINTSITGNEDLRQELNDDSLLHTLDKVNISMSAKRRQRPLSGGQLDGTYHGIDLMAQPTFTFDPSYKNPCWKETGTVHCLPYFFLIGVKKCGTSELWRNIATHPEIVKGNFGKEAQWFARKRFNKWGYWRHRVPKNFSHDSIDAYIDMFRRASSMIDKAESHNPTNGRAYHPMITGDASPSNLYLNSHWRYLPGNENMDEPKYVILDYIHHFIPQTKIIIIFRDPVDRLYSDYFHEYGGIHRRYFSPSPEHFHQLIENGLNLYKECFKNRTVRSCVYDERIYNEVGVNIQLGIYHVYWQDIRRLFPRDQILTLQNTELRDMNATVEKVFNFLGVQPLQETTLRVFKKEHAAVRRPKHSVKGDMLSETWKLLEDFYRPFKAEMCRLTGDFAFLYKHYTY